MRPAGLAFAVLLGLLVPPMPVQAQPSAPFGGFGDGLPPAPPVGGAIAPGRMAPGVPQAGWQPGAYGGPFQGFGDALPPADPVLGLDPATGSMGEADLGGLMNMLGGLQGLQGGGVDAGGLQALLGGLGGQGGMDQLLQLLGSMYGVDMSQGLDPGLIQQGMRNLQEMQTWEGMEGIDLSPIVNLLGGLDE